MPVTRAEADKIVRKISPVFSEVVKEYDFRKYPADQYRVLREQFAVVAAPPESIEQALVWKWGHWDKPNFPQHHRLLISEIQELWASLRKATLRHGHTTLRVVAETARPAYDVHHRCIHYPSRTPQATTADY